MVFDTRKPMSQESSYNDLCRKSNQLILQIHIKIFDGSIFGVTLSVICILAYRSSIILEILPYLLTQIIIINEIYSHMIPYLLTQIIIINEIYSHMKTFIRCSTRFTARKTIFPKSWNIIESSKRPRKYHLSINFSAEEKDRISNH